ncbi:hypothetical protein H8B09_04255 [Paenibacillus sp. PR3]|uniref:Uncharacterized protein n=1 Tax=Paenibacillus terricola TaxID=2763503 RepID=A0ABR8MRR5_9BACL|nr:hypothetical protein [Paenibacillus terricola]MBD3917956.1 hypothetical protein [Paenibacillus terricola]
MEKLIEFLIKNIYIVIVVGGFLLSAISKMKGNNNRQPRQMPPFGSGERPSVPSPVYSAPENQPSAGRRVWEDDEEEEEEGEYSPYAASSPSPAPVEQRPMSPVVQTVTPAPRRQPMIAAADKPSIEASDSSDNTSPELSAATLRQAIIWSEVLGPPRAKRPYRSK